MSDNTKKQEKLVNVFKMTTIIVIIISFLIVLSSVLVKRNNNFNDVSDLLDSGITSYIIYEDKIYYLTVKNKLFRNYYGIYSMKLDGTHEKKIMQTNKYRLTYLHYIYNNELCISVDKSYEKEIINLLTNKITTIEDNNFYIAESLKDGKIFSYNYNNFRDLSIIRKIDLNNNNNVLYEIDTINENSLVNYNTGDIYYLSDAKIYKNKQIIYDLKNNTDSKVNLLAIDDSFIWFGDNEYVYKLNTYTNEVENVINYNTFEFKRIKSYDSSNNYYYFNNQVYYFNIENSSVEVILNDVSQNPNFVLNTNNKVVFKLDTQVIIYDNITKGSITFDNVKKMFFDNKKIYFVVGDYQDYEIQKYNLN